ncbi:ATP-binding cassette domain-containing protein [Niallia sp. 03133]|uniref:ATP-binding cassette domain-containing protein n=1 Tax=Niallia sp. 03133 TaxID=3458060 RepID=UPI0040447223
MENIIQLQNVSKLFHNHKAVDAISFTIKKGETVAILGANGAGKTTTILMLLGLMKASTGSVRLFQSDFPLYASNLSYFVSCLCF